MSQSWDDSLIDSIVAGVMNRLRGESVPVAATQASKITEEAPAYRPRETVTISDRVVTEAVLVDRLRGGGDVQFTSKAVLTPTARDYLRTNNIAWNRGEAKTATAVARVLAIIVSEAPSVTRIIHELLPGARRELLGCVDEAARLAASEIARGGSESVLIFARQTHRAACAANRQSNVRAAAARDLAEVAAIRTQMRTNVWCFDPVGRGGFELRNLIKATTSRNQGY